eukprot:360591-Chlamydomonas_euryale.AAC.23
MTIGAAVAFAEDAPRIEHRPRSFGSLTNRDERNHNCELLTARIEPHFSGQESLLGSLPLGSSRKDSIPTGIYHVDAAALQRVILPDNQPREAIPPQRLADLVQLVIHLMDLRDNLPYPGPMLRPDALQDQQLGALHVDLEQVDSVQTLLIDDVA